MKNIWIINHHALTPSMSGGTRHYDFAKELINRGHKVTIIAASFHYAKYQEMKEYKDKEYLIENIDGIDFIWIKTPPYIGSGFSRVKNMISFMSQVLSIIPKLSLKNPDTIIGSSVHLFAVYAAYRLSLKYNAKFIMEVRDLWPQTLIDMGISSWHPFIILLGFMERFLYKKADSIISLLPNGYKYIQKYTQKNKIVWISNGTKISNKDQYTQKLDDQKFNILYTGTHGIANDLEVLIEVANNLKSKKNIHFTLLGDGPLKDKLINKTKEYKLTNITFLNSVPKDDVFDYLRSADLLYVGLKNLPLYKYGMSMNKVFDYMSEKKPILFVSSIKDNIIEKSNGGVVLRDNSYINISNTINSFAMMTKEKLKTYGDNNYNYLKNHFSIEVLTNKLEKIL